MMRYDEIQQNTPRLVVEFIRPTPDQERFSWGVVGKMPLLTLIGFITRVQSDLIFKSPDECLDSALVLVFNEKERSFNYFVNKDIPVDPLIGMLETIKLSLISSQAVQPRGINSSAILGPDGKPMFN